MNEVIRERLKSGGELEVRDNSWCISYYFPGPDMRYKGEYARVCDIEIDEYISAWKNNYAKCMELRHQVPDGGEFTMVGEKGMQIRVGGFRTGVCLIPFNLCIDTEEKLDEIVWDYEYAKVKAREIQKLLKAISEITPESVKYQIENG